MFTIYTMHWPSANTSIAAAIGSDHAATAANIRPPQDGAPFESGYLIFLMISAAFLFSALLMD